LRGMMEMSPSISEIASRLRRHRSTVQRELDRSPWQRGSIENANGRLRRDLPRKTSLGNHSDADIDDVIWNFNSSPRTCLGYRAPFEEFATDLGVSLEVWIQPGPSEGWRYVTYRF
jgi:IS30 family transposase